MRRSLEGGRFDEELEVLVRSRFCFLVRFQVESSDWDLFAHLERSFKPYSPGWM